MAFTVEDGTGLEAANAYIAVATADAYHTERGNADWVGGDALKQQAIIKATDYVETRFGLKFKGKKLVAAQALSFPRSYLYDKEGNLIEGIPAKLEKAVAEYALRALSASLLPDPSVEDNGLRVRSKKEVVGPIEEETVYATTGAVQVFKPYPAADALLREYIGYSSGGTIRA